MGWSGGLSGLRHQVFNPLAQGRHTQVDDDLKGFFQEFICGLAVPCATPFNQRGCESPTGPGMFGLVASLGTKIQLVLGMFDRLGNIAKLMGQVTQQPGDYEHEYEDATRPCQYIVGTLASFLVMSDQRVKTETGEPPDARFKKPVVESKRRNLAWSGFIAEAASTPSRAVRISGIIFPTAAAPLPDCLRRSTGSVAWT
jgi:hypothetical protein